MPCPSPVRDAIIKALNEHGPKTCRELVKLLGLTKEQVKSCLKDNRTKSNKVFYICGYGDLAGDGYRRPAKYAVGSQEDVPYSKVDRDSRDVRYRTTAKCKATQKRAREKARRVRQRVQRDKKYAETPFASLIMQIVEK
jgi:hypothetical protein